MMCSSPHRQRTSWGNGGIRHSSTLRWPAFHQPIRTESAEPLEATQVPSHLSRVLRPTPGFSRGGLWSHPPRRLQAVLGRIGQSLHFFGGHCLPVSDSSHFGHVSLRVFHERQIHVLIQQEKTIFSGRVQSDALRTVRRGKRKQLLSVRAVRGPNTVRVLFTNERSVHRGMHIGHSLFSLVVIRPAIFVGNGAQNFIEQTAATIAIRHDYSALTGIEIGYQDARESLILSAVTEVRNRFLSTQPQAQAIATELL